MKTIELHRMIEIGGTAFDGGTPVAVLRRGAKGGDHVDDDGKPHVTAERAQALIDSMAAGAKDDDDAAPAAPDKAPPAEAEAAPEKAMAKK